MSIAKVGVAGTSSPVTFFAHNAADVLDQPAVIASGQGQLPRGAVLGVRADGKYLFSKATANDGSQVPNAILAHAVDTATGDQRCPVYVRGTFAVSALTIGDGHSATSIAAPLRQVGIYCVTVQGT